MQTKYSIIFTTNFKKDYKLALKRGYSADDMQKVIELLANDIVLPPKYKDHALTGNYNGYRECHIKPDWLLIYKKDEEALVLYLTRTGSHSDLF